MNHTPQELGRTALPLHHHDVADAFCLDCITNDLLLDDVRREIALLAAIELKYLATVRATIDGLSWQDEWRRVLDIAALQADLRSDNTVRRLAARRAKEAVTHFLVYRLAATEPAAVRLRLAPQLREIGRITRVRLEAIEREGSEPAFFGHSIH